MKRLLPLLLLCACAGSLVDHDGASSTTPDSGGPPPTKACLDTCQVPPGTPEGTIPRCDGDVCTYTCPVGTVKTASTNPPSCSAVDAVAAGGNHTCAIAGGQVLCWGDNAAKELGVDAPALTARPLSPALNVAATPDQIAASTTQTCAHFSNGALWCWGAGKAPHEITGITGTINAIAAGEAHACAATDGAVWCWGDNASGQLGAGPSHQAALPVSGVPGAKVIAAGRLHTCAGTGSQLYCWGANDRGQAGNGTTASPAAPAVVQGAGASFLGAGEAHTCSAPANGSLSCWGANGANQIDGSLQDQLRPRGTVSGASAMAGGAGHTCAIESAGAVFCWGLNDFGQLASGDLVSKPGPNRTSLIEPASNIAAGTKHTCAIVANGVLKCWGDNGSGQLGIGAVGGRHPAPEVVTGL